MVSGIYFIDKLNVFFVKLIIIMISFTFYLAYEVSQ